MKGTNNRADISEFDAQLQNLSARLHEEYADKVISEIPQIAAWREVARTILDDDTQNCMLVLEALDPTTNDELHQAQQQLGELVKRYCGGTIEYHTLNAQNQSSVLL